MIEINWCSILIGIIIGGTIAGTIAGFVGYRLGYNKVWDDAHRRERMRILSWEL